jgi:predicted transcriptional regulator
MFGKHQSHHFKPMDIIYEAKYERIRELISELKGRIIKKEEILTEIENRLISIKAKAESNIAEIDDYTDKYKTKMAHNQIDDEE